MSRLIDADVLMNDLKKAIDESHNERRAFIDDEFVALVDDADIIEAEEVVHGWWIEHENYEDGVVCECSVCHEKYRLLEEHVLGRNYCPHCGARLDKE